MKGLIVENHKLQLSEQLEIPTPKGNEVLIKIFSASVNPTDAHIAAGYYDEIIPEELKKLGVLTGLEFSGEIEQDGKGFKKGEKVFGYVDLLQGQKTHQEYFAIDKDCIAKSPSNLSFDESASLPLGSQTTLVAFRDVAQLKSNERVLINGASGGLGIYAVQLAKHHFGAHVTAISGPGDEAFLSELGADVVFDYQKQNINELSEKYDVLLDLTTLLRYNNIANILSDKGRFIPADPNKAGEDLKEGTDAAKKTRLLMVAKGNAEDLASIAKWVEEEKIKPYVDSVYSINQFEKAFEQLAKRSKRGRIVLKII